MDFKVTKVQQEYTDKVSGESKKGWRYYLHAPSGATIAIRAVFQQDNGKLNVLIPAESEADF